MKPRAVRRLPRWFVLLLALAACTEAPRERTPEPGAEMAALNRGAAAPDSAGAALPRPAPPRPEPSLRLDVNLPAGRLDLYDEEKLRKSYQVSVGYLPYRTPVGSYLVEHVVWNPSWTPPESEWAKKRKKTPPGPSNPMGRAKLFFEDPDYYIHGTAAHETLGRPASHGCIRMANQDVVELARLLATRTGAASETFLVRAEERPSETREAYLPRPVRITIRYDRAELRADSLVVHRDIYGLEPDTRAAARRAWTRAGRPLSKLTPDVLAAAIAAGAPKQTTTAPDTLPTPHPSVVGTPVLLGTPVLAPTDSGPP